MKRFSSRFHLAVGLASLLLSIVLLGIYLGLVPDREHALRTGRIALAETIAVACSALLERDELAGLRGTLNFVMQRNPDILSVGIRNERGELVVDLRGHGAQWPKNLTAQPADGHLEVPLYQAQRRWGTVEIRFLPLTASGWRAVVFDPRTKLATFLVLASFVAFFFYLKRMLRHLDPARAVPARVRAALDTLAEGLLVLDPKGFIVLANRAFAAVVGREADDLVGRPVGALAWSGADGRSVEAGSLPWVDACRNGIAQRNGTVYLHNAHALRRTFRVNCTPVLGAGVKDTPVLVSLDDVTDIEEKEVQLIAARSKAEAANRSKSEFLANMSHEIRTPMNAILGFTELLRRARTYKSGDLRKHLDIIHASGVHLLGLINDILDLSKVEAGRVEVERIECAPLQVLREVVQVLAVRAQEKGIALTLEYVAPIPSRILSDPARMRQIVTNLIGNAIKFTSQGGVRVRPRFEPDGEEGRLVVDITDSGIGIPVDKIEQIFDPFTQAEASTTRRFGGTGLGLTISRRFARALGGDITAHSTPGTGSVFSLVLPTGPSAGAALLDQAAFESLQEAPRPPEAAGAWSFPPVRVLVVDDGAENRQLVRLVLEECGIRVSDAENGQAALDMIARESFAAVLMDVQMPIMDGFTATRRLREAGNTVPVIALTANAMKGFEQEIEAAGFSGYLTKPVDLDALLADLAGRLGGSRIAAPVDSAPPQAANESLEEPIVSRLAQHPRLQSVVIRFAEQLPGKLSAMEAALQRADCRELGELAHWLKGSGGTVGYDAFFEPARSLEESARVDDIEAIAGKLAELRAMAARIVVPAGSAMPQLPLRAAERAAG